MWLSFSIFVCFQIAFTIKIIDYFEFMLYSMIGDLNLNFDGQFKYIATTQYSKIISWSTLNHSIMQNVMHGYALQLNINLTSYDVHKSKSFQSSFTFQFIPVGFTYAYKTVFFFFILVFSTDLKYEYEIRKRKLNLKLECMWNGQ